ncbi:MAG: hypothetical protein GX772_09000 [Alcaligenaceae bacterium]|nr:hypothetical protein [Alcaligenaceae bacterium]
MTTRQSARTVNKKNGLQKQLHPKKPDVDPIYGVQLLKAGYRPGRQGFT